MVEWLRSTGHDVVYAAEAFAGDSDDVLRAAATRENRILVTDDKDFGELVFRRRLASQGVILIRLSTPRIQDRLRRLEEVWSTIEAQLTGRLIVITDTKVRTRPIRLRR